ncbi:MAG: hypothetical protein LUQ52_05570, partial [Methylococcaceae bacterium]|nr:hypothetical protein [Methylococcaceae bacterium]
NKFVEQVNGAVCLTVNTIEDQFARQNLIKPCKIAVGFSLLTHQVIQQPGINNVNTNRHYQ